MGLHQRQRCLRRFLHHLAELPGEDQPAVADRPAGLDEQDVTTDRRPRQSGGDTGQPGTQGDFVVVAAGAEDAGEIGFADLHAGALALGDLHRDTAADGTDLAFERAHARFARVVADDRLQRCRRELDLSFVQAVLHHLPADQIAFGDFELFLLRVAGQLDDLHAVAQRSRDVVEHVGRGDEEHPRQVEGQRQVVVAETVVLLRVEHLEQRRRRVALEARAELVDLVEHHHAAA